MRIEDSEPSRWEELEEHVARILAECGMRVRRQLPLALARGSVNVDVAAVDPSSTPPTTLLVECKRWKHAINRDVVHGFRTVLHDAGANRGLLISAAGFRSGARAAAQFTNLDLLTWSEFQSMFASRWYRTYMVPLMQREADPLLEYTEPMNSRIFGKADQLTARRQSQFVALREKYADLALGLLPLRVSIQFPPPGSNGPVPPTLPLRATSSPAILESLPDDVLDATALRPLLGALTYHFHAAIAEFDGVFGGRA